MSREQKEFNTQSLKLVQRRLDELRSSAIALTEIYASVGEHEEALRLIDHLPQVPSFMSVEVLKLDPEWDRLRKDPRFQALVDKYAAKQ